MTESWEDISIEVDGSRIELEVYSSPVELRACNRLAELGLDVVEEF